MVYPSRWEGIYDESLHQLADFDVSVRDADIRTLIRHLVWLGQKGLLFFNNQTLGQIMSTLSLWYDMEVFFQNPVLEQLHFTGCVSDVMKRSIIFLESIVRECGRENK